MNYNKFVENSRKWLKKYIQNNHLESCVLGISGGIDSTVSACIAFPVCKELDIPLIGRSLPCKTNKNSENDVAILVGQTFCTNFKLVSIEKMYSFVENELLEYEGVPNAIQQGNIKARLRMLYLRHLASIHKGVVLDNDNFTEWNLGFFTKNGDVGDINLGIHYLWKTEIYELAGYLEKYHHLCYLNNMESKDKWKAIYESIKLTPTDGNGVATGGDCGQFGLDNYEQVDDVLKTMYYPEGSPISSEKDEYIRLIDSYNNEQGVDKVMCLHQTTAYKRIPAPIMPTKEELEL